MSRPLCSLRTRALLSRLGKLVRWLASQTRPKVVDADEDTGRPVAMATGRRVRVRRSRASATNGCVGSRSRGKPEQRRTRPPAAPRWLTSHPSVSSLQRSRSPAGRGSNHSSECHVEIFRCVTFYNTHTHYIFHHARRSFTLFSIYTDR